MDYECETYQKQFDTFLYYLYRFKTDEKITPEQLLSRLYGSKTKRIKSDKSLMHHITSSLRTILLYYFNWLGVIDIEGEEIVEGMGIFSIKKFWITSAGRKLIKRLIENFIETGRIKIPG